MTGSETTAEDAGRTWSAGKTKQSGRDVWDGVEWIMFSMDEPGLPDLKRLWTPAWQFIIVERALGDKKVSRYAYIN